MNNTTLVDYIFVRLPTNLILTYYNNDHRGVYLIPLIVLPEIYLEKCYGIATK